MSAQHKDTRHLKKVAALSGESMRTFVSGAGPARLREMGEAWLNRKQKDSGVSRGGEPPMSARRRNAWLLSPGPGRYSGVG